MITEERPDLSGLAHYQLWMSKDNGYQGYRPDDVHFLEPFKARQDKPLTDFLKSFNFWISSVRSIVEHSISGIKRLVLLTQMLRYHKQSGRH